MKTIKKSGIIVFFLGVIALFNLSCKEDSKTWLKPSLEQHYFTVDENSGAGTIVGTVELSNTLEENVEYSIIGGNEQDFFSIDNETGIISVKNGANLDFELKPESTLTVEVTGTESDLISNSQIVISINDTNEIPLIGLVANYKFDGTWNDYSGNQYDATNTGTVFSTDRFNSANQSLQFNGLSDYLTLPSDFDFQNKSISLWFNASDIPVFDYLNNPNTSWGSLVTCDYPDLQYGSLNLGVTKIDGTDKVFFYEGGMDSKVNPNLLVTPINKNGWHHLVLTLSDQIIKLYLDGNLINSYKSAFLNSVNGNPNMMIGTSRGATARYFNGKIDDLLIYNRILSLEEVYIISME